MTHLLPWLHLLGIALSFGSGLFFAFIFYPSLQKIADPQERMKVLAESLRFFHPAFLLGICIVFVTGAMRLTDLKIGFGGAYFASLSNILYWKFGLTTAIFMLASMQCFGMGLKLGRMATGVIPGDLELQEKYARKIRRVTIWNLILLAVTMYVGLKLAPIIYGGP